MSEESAITVVRPFATPALVGGASLAQGYME